MLKLYVLSSRVLNCLEPFLQDIQAARDISPGSYELRLALVWQALSNAEQLWNSYVYEEGMEAVPLAILRADANAASRAVSGVSDRSGLAAAKALIAFNGPVRLQGIQAELKHQVGCLQAPPISPLSSTDSLKIHTLELRNFEKLI